MIKLEIRRVESAGETANKAPNLREHSKPLKKAKLYI